MRSQPVPVVLERLRSQPVPVYCHDIFDLMNRYILENEQPTLCSDKAVWLDFMRGSNNLLVAQDAVSRLTVITVSIGVNIGSHENPLFFNTFCLGSDMPMPLYSNSKDRAIKNHESALAAATVLLRKLGNDASGDSAENSFTTCEFNPPNELHYILKTEAEAIRMMNSYESCNLSQAEKESDNGRLTPFNKNLWKRQGNSIVLLLPI